MVSAFVWGFLYSSLKSPVRGGAFASWTNAVSASARSMFIDPVPLERSKHREARHLRGHEENRPQRHRVDRKIISTNLLCASVDNHFFALNPLYELSFCGRGVVQRTGDLRAPLMPLRDRGLPVGGRHVGLVVEGVLHALLERRERRLPHFQDRKSVV